MAIDQIDILTCDTLIMKPPDIILLHEPGTVKQATVRIFLPDHSQRPLPDDGHGGARTALRLDLHLSGLRGVKLWTQGNILLDFQQQKV